MMSNLLLALNFPENLNVIKTDIEDYRDLKKITKGGPKHLKGKKLFFFGDTNSVHQALISNSAKSEILEPIQLSSESICDYWDIILVLFYRYIKSFLIEKKFQFHRNFAYMTGLDYFQNTSLITQDNNYNYYIHEGFHYKLYLLNNNIFLALIPTIVLTKDKKIEIISKEEGSRFYTHHGSRRWNTITRTRLDLWRNFLSDGDTITIPIPNTRGLVFENNFSHASENDIVNIKGD